MFVKCVLSLLSSGRSSGSERSLISAPPEPSRPPGLQGWALAISRNFIKRLGRGSFKARAFIAIATRSRSTRLPAPHNFNSPPRTFFSTRGQPSASKRRA